VERDQLLRQCADRPAEVGATGQDQFPTEADELVQGVELRLAQAAAVEAVDQDCRVAAQVGGLVRERVGVVPLGDLHRQLAEPDRFDLAGQRLRIGESPDRDRFAIVHRTLRHLPSERILDDDRDEVVGREEGIGLLVARAQRDGELEGCIGRVRLAARGNR